MHFRPLLLLVFTVSTTISAYGQFGLNGTWNFPDTPFEDLQLNNLPEVQTNEFYTSGFSIGIDYWFRPEKFRLEFMPEFNFSQMRNDVLTTGTLQSTALGIRLNMNIYPFDFLSDCDCPTWSKQDPIFQKGFFFQLSPGFQYWTHQYLSAASHENEIMHDTSWRLAAGAGLDIGISDLVTLTPFVRYAFQLGAQEAPFEDVPPFEFQESTDLSPFQPWSQWEAGLRIGIRLDE